MPKRIALVIVLISLVWTSCSPVANNGNIRWVTLRDIEKSLENEPVMSVGFDIDDTVLFSSPGFYYGQQKYSPGNDAYLVKEEFWKEMNNGLDRFSIPKDCARNLIEFHRKRGDSIYFITARTKVIFTGFKILENLKIRPIRENNIQIFYGDSDGDIQAAQAAGARPIRILRPENSTNKPIPRAGSLGEEVLKDSDH